ncbi:hypothetical protein [Amycolatopsis sp. CA-128772]|uniref:hypothetical protein n=1 Tax=Amycolatopsis sp. CA-128772 TaxID=2073159 RepID=UPI0011AFE972|nr:hypothetical protein [Amycolatopsis sp. CA-128772]
MRRKTLWLAAIVVLVLAGGGWLLTLGHEPEAAVAPPAAPACGPVTTADSTGRPLDERLLTPVRAAHDAACHRDYAALARLMDRPFGTRSPDAALAELRENDGAPLTILAQTLEVPALADQGGLTYCHPHGAIAVFARGTPDHQGKLTDFTLTGDNPMEEACYEANPR